MANVYVERPKGRPEGTRIDDYVVEDLPTMSSRPSERSGKQSIGREIKAMPRLSLASGT
jgi:hypothetical protein